MIENQESIGTWVYETFPGIDPSSPRKAIRALEEMVELCLASGASPNAIQEAVENTFLNSESTYQSDKIAAEAADVLIVLYGLAHMRGFDLHAEVDAKMIINRSRKWKVLSDGTGYHVK